MPHLNAQADTKLNVEKYMAERTERSDGCWIWVGNRSPLGYGRMRVNGKTKFAHRVAYELSKGAIPAGLVIDHMCHTPSCVRPDHLQAVTQKQNVENMKGLRPDNKSGVRGVFWNAEVGRWRASVGHNRRRYNLGHYDTLAEAEQAAKAKRLELFTNNLKDRC